MRTSILKTGLLAPLLLPLLLAAAGSAVAQIDPAAFYQIVAKHSGKCLDVAGGPDAQGNGVRVIQFECNGASNQQWKLVPVGDGYYKVLAKHSGKSLDVFGGNIATGNGVIVEQWDYHDGDNQLWRFDPVEEGYYRIVAKHSGKSLDISGGPDATGNEVQAQQWDDVGGSNQRWALTAVRGAAWAAMTRFNPVTDGFQFDNSFKNDLSGGARSDGLCGGMMYAALDYFFAGQRVPGIDYRPAIGTTLQTYLLNRQTTQIASNLDRFEDMILASGPGADKQGYFERGLNQQTLGELRAKIDAGTPVVLALQNANDALGHSVLAIGYDMGRYRGDLGEHKEDLRIFVYDPNHPRQTRTLAPELDNHRYVYTDGFAHDEHAKWVTYFVDTRYKSTAVPTIPEPDLGGSDGLVHELRLMIQTGGDELVGGNDDIQLTMHIDGKPPLVFANLNNHMRWLANYGQTISLPLDTPVRAADIRSFDLSKTAHQASLGVDGWDLDSVDIDAYGGGVAHFSLFHAEGHPLTRFTEHFTTYSADIPPR